MLTEALAEQSGIDIYWQGVTGYNRGSHPSTWYMMQGVLRIGEFVAMFQKNKFQRPRPWQVSPALLPPVRVPGHASYPSAHATQSNLMSLCLGDVLAQATGQPRPTKVTDLPEPLLRIAQRVARNREVLGLHYPSDSAAGLDLAEQTFPILRPAPPWPRSWPRLSRSGRSS